MLFRPAIRPEDPRRRAGINPAIERFVAFAQFLPLQPVDLPVEGAEALKAAIVPVILTYTTTDPLG